jgi:hypothetical protein
VQIGVHDHDPSFDVDGLFMTMVEPRILVGTFQISVMWWAFAGVVCAAGLRKHAREQATMAALPPKSLMNFV